MISTSSSWAPPASGTAEHFIVVRPEGGGPFAAQVARLFALYEAERARLDLAPDSAVTVTLFLSDSANQEDELRLQPGFAGLLKAGAGVTVVQQPPMGAKVALFAYHVVRAAGTADRLRLVVPGVKSKANGLQIATDHYRFFYLRNLLALRGGGAGEQTDALLGTPGAGAQSHGIVLSQVVRTWLFVSDLDTNYTPVSTARNRVFDRNGITRDAGFPASTGIQGRSAEAGDLLLLDLLAVKGLQPGQNRRMEVLTHMNNTVDYGVTFERGRELVFGDRRHLYVSGTASINNQGEILHLGDVARQTERAIENVRALLENSAARLEDMRYLIVYLRDVHDAALVDSVLADSGLGAVPRLLVHAPVCRPGWLVEFEGVAVDGKGDAKFGAF